MSRGRVYSSASSTLLDAQLYAHTRSISRIYQLAYKYPHATQRIANNTRRVLAIWKGADAASDITLLSRAALGDQEARFQVMQGALVGWNPLPGLRVAKERLLRPGAIRYSQLTISSSGNVGGGERYSLESNINLLSDSNLNWHIPRKPNDPVLLFVKTQIWIGE